MKATGHPKYFDAKVTCACGNTYMIGSTKPSIDVEICSKCHPFYTGEMKFIDTLGRVERFQQKISLQQTQGKPLSKKARLLQKTKEAAAEEAARPKSLKEMFDRVKATA